MIVLTRGEVAKLLDLADCIDAVEHAFVQHGRGELPAAPGILGVHVLGGGYHIKTAALGSRPGYFAAKINANFPENFRTLGLPTIQGVIALFELESGRPLALLDSIEITILRTAAASAVAARRLALADARRVTICGCGVQGRSHLRALAIVRPLTHAYAIDADPARAATFASELSTALGFAVTPNVDLSRAVADSDVCVTSTPSRRPIFHAGLLKPGLFIAAVGADNPEKQEIEPAALAKSNVVVDLLEQAASIGDLHHAIDAGVMRASDVHAELGQVLAGLRPGRTSDDETFVFDSTGTALQDVAAAAVVYERAIRAGCGTTVELT
ncbi:MAG TPA: ornithine cyclodeaminase family protein [Gemmatimonadaceae bacterium]|jgi:ornithine cyclodeaminase/alanine dehydrogenase-like protein (mu-crystallin family)